VARLFKRGDQRRLKLEARVVGSQVYAHAASLPEGGGRGGGGDAGGEDGGAATRRGTTSEKSLSHLMTEWTLVVV
jgi:hypothetical protein